MRNSRLVKTLLSLRRETQGSRLLQLGRHLLDERRHKDASQKVTCADALDLLPRCTCSAALGLQRALPLERRGGEQRGSRPGDSRRRTLLRPTTKPELSSKTQNSGKGTLGTGPGSFSACRGPSEEDHSDGGGVVHTEDSAAELDTEDHQADLCNPLSEPGIPKRSRSDAQKPPEGWATPTDGDGAEPPHSGDSVRPTLQPTAKKYSGSGRLPQKIPTTD